LEITTLLETQNENEIENEWSYEIRERDGIQNEMEYRMRKLYLYSP
jgi:hypothetical protein